MLTPEQMIAGFDAQDAYEAKRQAQFDVMAQRIEARIAWGDPATTVVREEAENAQRDALAAITNKD